MSKFVGFTTDDKSDREIKEWLREVLGWRAEMNLVILDMEPNVDYDIKLIPKRKAKK
jgi:hypothetical protein